MPSLRSIVVTQRRRVGGVGLAAAAMGLGVALHAAHALFGLGGHGLDGFFTNDVYTAVQFLAVAVCGARVVARSDERWVWGLMTSALLTWTGGDLVWTLWLNNLANPPFPSIADVLYLAMYPAMYVALMLLIRSRIRSAGASQWLDGGVVALALAAIGAGLILPGILAGSRGRAIEDIINLAYPLSDLTLLVFVVVALAVSGWRVTRLWAFLGAGIALNAIADLIYAYLSARGAYVAGGILDTMWPAALSLVALAAWQPRPREEVAPTVPVEAFALPVIATAAALGLLVDAALTRVSPVAVALAAASLVVGALRATLTYCENVRMLRRTEREAVTDGLTGLGNRRALMQDLDAVAGVACEAEPATLVFFDLNGFKQYNDTFGHAAGDALLVRLGTAVRAAVEPTGRAYRLGGDEFCVLFSARVAREAPEVSAAVAALTEVGSGFTVTASCGVAVLPDDAADAGSALQLADQRMYSNKARIDRTGGLRTRDVLLALLSERAPALHNHIGSVAALARPLAQAFGLGSEETDEVLRAADLHDIGKLAVPDQILNKPGPLDEAEWRFIRQHPLVGERILNVDPALRPVARLVRATHERWDGGGYPDGLAAAEIPLGARIIAVCDAFEAMTRGRWYRPGRSRSDAIAELRRHAGSQFDPAVVDAFCELALPRSAATPSAAAGPVRELA